MGDFRYGELEVWSGPDLNRGRRQRLPLHTRRMPQASSLTPRVARLSTSHNSDTNNKSFNEQTALLLDGEEVAPIVLAAMAMLCHKKAGLPDPLQGDWVRCRESTNDADAIG